MNVIILAGGLGTRLHPITKDKYPKCMVDVNGKPFLEHLINQISKFNVYNIIFSIGHKSKRIKDYHFEQKFKDLNFLYSEENEPLGTGGAINFLLGNPMVLDKPLAVVKESFIVLNGDTFTTINLNKMMKFHKEKKSTVSMAVKFVGDVSKYGHIIFDKNKKIVKYIEKDSKMPGYINAGVYIINGTVKTYLSEKCSFEEDFLQKLPVEVYAFEDDFNFIDIGTPEGYKEFVRQTIEEKSL